MPKALAVLMLILCLVMGTCFVFYEGLPQRPVDRSEAQIIEATYEDYELNRHSLHIRIREFTKPLIVWTDGMTPEQRQQIETIPPGERLSLLIHPHKNVVLEMSDHDNTLVSYEDTAKMLRHESTGFILFGLFFYLFAAYFAESCGRRKFIKQRTEGEGLAPPGVLVFKSKTM